MHCWWHTPTAETTAIMYRSFCPYCDPPAESNYGLDLDSVQNKLLLNTTSSSNDKRSPGVSSNNLFTSQQILRFDTRSIPISLQMMHTLCCILQTPKVQLFWPATIISTLYQFHDQQKLSKNCFHPTAHYRSIAIHNTTTIVAQNRVPNILSPRNIPHRLKAKNSVNFTSFDKQSGKNKTKNSSIPKACAHVPKYAVHHISQHTRRG